MSYLSALGPLGSVDETISPMLQPTKERICPKPVKAESKLKVTKPARKFQGHAWPVVEGEAGHEILDILFSKVSIPAPMWIPWHLLRANIDSVFWALQVNAEDAGSPNRSVCYLLGSPPVRAGNPVIHDVHFSQDRVSKVSLKSPPCKPSSVAINKTACGAARGLAPCVRIEGFVSSAAPDSELGYELCLTRCVTLN